MFVMHFTIWNFGKHRLHRVPVVIVPFLAFFHFRSIFLLLLLPTEFSNLPSPLLYSFCCILFNHLLNLTIRFLHKLKSMQLYHHPYSVDSQRVRLALEEKGIDYTSFHLNPVTGKNMNASFFRMNTSATLPVFQNGDHKIFKTIEIIQYVERIASVSTGIENMTFSGREVTEWMQRLQEWNPKFFTLAHIPDKYFRSASKFLRRVLMARMEESPDLAGAYHSKLQEVYDTEDKLKNSSVVIQDKEHLIRLLDEVEKQLSETPYLAGEEFTMADVMLIPVLARLVLLNLEDEYIGSRPNTAKYWIMVQQRPSYKKVIGNHFSGWRKYITLMKTWCSIHIRSILRRF